MEARLAVLLGDIDIITTILKMTDCENSTSLMQVERLSVLNCEDTCTKKSFVQFDHMGMQKQIKQLQSSVSRDLLKDTFSDLFKGIEGLESMDLVQTDSKQATPLVAGQIVALTGGKNGKNCADEGNKVICNRGHIRGWEKFTVAKAG